MTRRAADRSDAERYLMCEFIDASTDVGPHLKEFESLLLTPKYQETNMFVKTFEERGAERGEIKGRVGMLCRQLTAKSGKPDPPVAAKLESLTVEQLDELGEKLMNPAVSLADLGLEP
jgi:hypothetical protein